MRTKLFLTALALMAVTALASTQDPVAVQGQGNCKSPCNGTGKGVAFVDKNNNGICDNYENRTANAANNNGNGNGKCDGTGKGQGKGKGRNFVDANKNGICDYYEAKANVKK